MRTHPFVTALHCCDRGGVSRGRWFGERFSAGLQAGEGSCEWTDGATEPLMHFLLNMKLHIKLSWASHCSSYLANWRAKLHAHTCG